MKHLNQEQKNMVKNEYLFRFLNLLIWFLIIVLALWIVSLVPAYLNASVNKETLVNQYNDSNTADLEKDREVLQNLKNDVALKSTAVKVQETKYSEVINVITSSQIVGISISNIIFDSINDQDIVRIQGIASSRQKLLDFSSALETVEIFNNVDLPLSSFTRDTDLPFTLTLDLIKND